MENSNTLQQIFNENELYLWVIEYGITHEVIRFALHKGVSPKHIEVICGGVKYFSGQLKGGPYSLTIIQEQENIMVRSNDLELQVIFESINKITYIREGF